MIDCPPQVVPFAVDLHEHLVEMPPPVAGAHTLDPALPDLRSERRPEAVPLEPDGLAADLYAPFVEQVFHVPQ